VIESSDVFEEKIKQIFSKKKTKEIDLILQALSIVIYSTQNNTDIIEMYNLLDLNDFIKLITLFDGRVIKFPTKKQLRNSLMLAILYYYREIEGKSWDEIQKEFPFDISSISYGIQIKNLNNFIKQKIYEILKDVNKPSVEALEK